MIEQTGYVVLVDGVIHAWFKEDTEARTWASEAHKGKWRKLRYGLVIKPFDTPEQLAEEAREKEERYESLNALMQNVYVKERYRWCNSYICGCLGCANLSGGLEAAGVLKEEWEEWVAKNPRENML